MPKCLICRTDFYAQSHLSPREDCDCGANISERIYRDMDDSDRSTTATLIDNARRKEREHAKR